MSFTKSTLTLALSLALLSGCNESDMVAAESTTTSAQASTSVNTLTESEKANQLFDEIFMEGVNRNPIYQTYLGIKKDYDKWNDISEANTEQELMHTKSNLVRIQSLNFDKLDAQTQLSYTLLKQNLENRIADHQWRHYTYPVNQMFGTHSQVPSLLINQHAVNSIEDANAYISRLQKVDGFMAELVNQLKIREQKGIIAPKFVYQHVIRDINNLFNGAPFTQGEASTLYADITKKVNKLEISDEQKNTLIKAAEQALLTHFKTGYDQLLSYLNHLVENSDDRDGAWKFPNGERFYNNALNRTTTTDLSADDIHQIGLNEVARIHDEMRTIMKSVGFEGDLAAFFEFMRHDNQFYYPGTDEGREQYLTKATAVIDDMKQQLDKLFITKPKADLVVKKVEAFREKSAGKAFYQQPAPDGSRPGFYYANLYDMNAMPTYQLEALAFHEGIPGHHMQIALKQELEGLPKFRKFGGYTAYTEGWGLYSEMIPKEIGFYQDPYSDFGRLAMELWRACRLVVDTGIHTKKWTREQGIEYYVNNTPNAESDAVKMVERHIVMPSQATAYKVGMIKILELRQRAKTKLGDKFDIREFHDVVLTNGAVPLNVLEDMVNQYISRNS